MMFIRRSIDSKKYNIIGFIKIVLGMNCEVVKLMEFLKETKIFEEMNCDGEVLQGQRASNSIVTNDFDAG